VREQLTAGAQSLAVNLDKQQIDKLLRFLELLSKWNKVYNLTAVRSMEAMVGRHIFDSLSVWSCLPEPVDESTQSAPMDAINTHHNATPPRVDVLDVGTGAGLPVIPLAIARPDLQFLSVESNGKKTRFQHQVIQELGLVNIRVVQERIEDVLSPAHTIISRAFTAPEKFLLAIRKNCIANSRVIVMLGVKEKMPSVLPTGFNLLELKQVSVPQCESERHVAVCENS